MNAYLDQHKFYEPRHYTNLRKTSHHLPQYSYQDHSQQQHLQAWIDATADDGLEEVRDIPSTPQNKPDRAMICDIQRVASRLVAKAPQLIGMLDT